MVRVNIDNIAAPQLEIYTKYNEVQLMRFFEPYGGIFIAETPMVIERALDLGCIPLSFLIEEEAARSELVNGLLKRADKDYSQKLDKLGPKLKKRLADAGLDNQLIAYIAPLSEINSLTGFNLTRGVLGAFLRPELISPKELLAKGKNIAVLEDVLNPTNVGAIFRSAAALGVDGIILTSPCADPFYRRASRVAMGTTFQVPWTYFEKGSDYCQLLHDLGYKIVSMALKDNAISVADERIAAEKKLAIFFGTEATGIKDETIEKSDYVAIIPMHNGVDSLNVAAASSVTFWELCGRRMN